MSRILFTAATCAALLGPAVAQAALMTGSFSGTMDGGVDVTGVFGSPGGDLTGDSVTGTFVYDTAKYSQVIAGGVNTATATSTGAMSVTLTIAGHSHTFTDQSSASILLDTNASEATYQDANNTGGKNESFFLDLSDVITPFLTSTSLTAPVVATDPFSSAGSFSIADVGPTVAVGGSYSLGTLTVQVQVTAAPEPASLALLGVGLAGVVGVRRRRKG